MIDKVEDKPEEKTPEEIAAAEAADETALFDAVSGAIDEVTITPEKKDDDTDNDDEPGDEDADAELDAGSDTGAADDAGDKEDPPGEEPTDKDADADPDATPGAEGGDDAPKDADKPGDEPKDGDGTPAELDPINDPIPEATNEKTATRIKSLIGIIQTKDESEQQRNEIVEQITATGTDPDQYANTLGFLKLYNSGNVTERKQALEVARGLVKELALELGEGSTVTKLSDHEDLSAEVEAGTLSEARALEIAATREADKLRATKDEATATAATTESTTQQNLATGKEQLDVFETAVRTSDENYANIRPTFVKLLGPILKRTHPTEWGAAAQEVYDQVKDFVPAAKPKPKPKPKNTPIRPKQGAGAEGKSTEADDVLGAVDAALANM